MTCTVTTRAWSACSKRAIRSRLDCRAAGGGLAPRASRLPPPASRFPLPASRFPVVRSPPLYAYDDRDPIRIRVVGEGREVARLEEECCPADGESDTCSAVEAELRLRLGLYS